jgi:hypothetical protein
MRATPLTVAGFRAGRSVRSLFQSSDSLFQSSDRRRALDPPAVAA